MFAIVQHSREQKLNIRTTFPTCLIEYKSEKTEPKKQRHSLEGKIAQPIKKFATV
jgi:hypothetical protein